MRKLVLLLSGLAILLYAAPVFALPTFDICNLHIFDDRGYEKILTDVGTPGVIDVGDVLEGIILVERIDVVSGPNKWAWNNPGDPELTGYFKFEVQSTNYLYGADANPNSGIYDVVFSPTDSSIEFYYGEGANADWSNTNPTIAQAKSGLQYAVGNVKYWQGRGPVSLAWWLANYTQTAQFWGGFDLAVNNTGYEWETLIPGLGYPDGGPRQPVQMYTAGAGVGPTNPANYTNGWQMWFNDVNTYAHPVPEPTSMALLGIGLLGLLGLRRKKVA